MKLKDILIWAIAVLALVLSIVGLVGEKQSASTILGGVTNYDTVSATGLKVGVGCADGNTSCAGSSITSIIKGTCDLVGGTIAATTTGYADCAVTGVLPGDLVFASFATTTPAASIIAARASSTSGFITLKVLNLSGLSNHITAFGTSTEYYVVR